MADTEDSKKKEQSPGIIVCEEEPDTIDWSWLKVDYGQPVVITEWPTFSPEPLIVRCRDCGKAEASVAPRKTPTCNVDASGRAKCIDIYLCDYCDYLSTKG